jgi:tellurite resistance protein
MGYRRDYDLNAIRHGIWSMRAELLSQYTDSYVAWDTKQKLYQLKWLIDDTLAKSATFADEKQWLEDEEKQRVWEILNQK